jgi:hypothetical protein
MRQQMDTHKGWILTGQRIGRHRYRTYVTKPDHYVPSPNAHGGPLRIADRYAAGRPRR